MAVVYKAKDTVLERVVALKLMNAQLFGVPEMQERFLREARAAASLHHPNIIVIYDFGQESGVPFIAMEFLPGQSLCRIIDKKLPLALPEKLDLALQIARGLEHAHQNSVIHRDVKPGNIQVLPGGKIKLVDFGIAKLASQHTTLTGRPIGTPAYMAPEQLQGKGSGIHSDIYSFGVVLYELLCYHSPYTAPDLAALIYKIATAPPEPMGAIEDRLPPELLRLVRNCLDKELGNRPASMTDVASALQGISSRLASGPAQNARARETVRPFPPSGSQPVLPGSPEAKASPTRYPKRHGKTSGQHRRTGAPAKTPVDCDDASHPEAPSRWILGLLSLLAMFFAIVETVTWMKVAPRAKRLWLQTTTPHAMTPFGPPPPVLSAGGTGKSPTIPTKSSSPTALTPALVAKVSPGRMTLAATKTASATKTPVPAQAATPVPTKTATATKTPVPGKTATPFPTRTATPPPSKTSTKTSIPSRTPSGTPSRTPSPTASRSPRPPSPTRALPPSPSPTKTATPGWRADSSTAVGSPGMAGGPPGNLAMGRLGRIQRLENSGRYDEALEELQKLKKLAFPPIQDLEAWEKRLEKNRENLTTSLLKAEKALTKGDAATTGSVLAGLRTGEKELPAARKVLEEYRSACAVDCKPPSVLYDRPLYLASGPLKFLVVANDKSGVEQILLHYRFEATAEFTSHRMTRNPDGSFTLEIPESVHKGRDISYYFEAKDRQGNRGFQASPM